MKRKVQQDSRGKYLSVGGWIIRPATGLSQHKPGDMVEITGGLDPIGIKFGTVVGKPHERWTIHRSETATGRAAREKKDPDMNQDDLGEQEREAREKLNAAASAFGASLVNAMNLSFRVSVAKQMVKEFGPGPWILHEDGRVEAVYRTKTGKLLSEADIAKLVEEAERGYDVKPKRTRKINIDGVS
jgi:hypothetical protein